MGSLSESFEKKYGDGRAGYQSPDRRPESIDEVRSLSPRWQNCWMLEELFDIRLEIWGKSRAKLNTDDLTSILESALDELDAVPVLVEEVREECS